MNNKLIISLALVIGLIAGGLSFQYYQTRPIPFDATIWTDPDQQSSYPRLQMADWLIKTDYLRDKNKPEIDQLLGTPPETGYFSDYDYVYWLGPERSFMSIDSEWLGIMFDEEGRVTQVDLLRD